MINESFKLYTVKKQDTLTKISELFYNSDKYINKIVEYNNLKNSNAIFVNQQLEIPPIEELEHKIQTTTSKILVPVPNGLNELITTFGDITKYITKSGELSPSWNLNQLTTITLPFPLKLAWNFKTPVILLTCHKKLATTFYNTFKDIQTTKLEKEVKSFGGTFSFRAKRKSNNLSTHSWGISIDLNTLSNAMGTPGDMHPGIVKCFRDNGFKWGGDWKGIGCDPMHFQYCTGY